MTTFDDVIESFAGTRLAHPAITRYVCALLVRIAGVGIRSNGAFEDVGKHIASDQPMSYDLRVWGSDVQYKLIQAGVFTLVRVATPAIGPLKVNEPVRAAFQLYCQLLLAGA